MTIGMLLTPAIGRLDINNLAGTERVFVDDVGTLSAKYHVSAFARESLTASKIQKLPFFHLIVVIAEKIRQVIGSSNVITNGCKMVADFCYCLFFLARASNLNLYINYSFPLLAIFFPKRTVTIMQSFQPLPLIPLFRTRYQKSIFIFCSKSLKTEYLMRYPWLKKATLQVLYNAVDTELFKPRRSKNKTSDKKKIKLLFCSAWVPEKGLDVLLEALLILPTKVRSLFEVTIASNSHLWYFDFDEHISWYIKKVESIMERITNVKVLGGVDHRLLPKLYAEHDYLVFPSVWKEPFGLVVAEALACGIPVITFKVGAIPEIVSDNNALLLSRPSPHTLARVLRRLSKSKKPIIRRTKSLLTDKNRLMIKKEREKVLISLVESIVS